MYPVKIGWLDGGASAYAEARADFADELENNPTKYHCPTDYAIYHRGGPTPGLLQTAATQLVTTDGVAFIVVALSRAIEPALAAMEALPNRVPLILVFNYDGVAAGETFPVLYPNAWALTVGST